MTVPSMMRAIRIHAPGEADALRDEQIAVPTPQGGEALVKVEASGVNFIDVYHRKGLYPKPLPLTLGSEAAGTVVAVGDGVTDVRVGDRVAYENVLGSYAEYAVVPAHRLVSVPDDVSASVAAALMIQGLTAHYLATSTYVLREGTTCLVHAAAGGVGLLLCQIAKRRGARVIGTVSTEEKAALAREAGADEIINYMTHEFDAEVRRLTDGVGVEVVYDSVGRTTFDRSLGSLARRGMLVLFGQSSGPVPPVDPQLLNRSGSLFLTRPNLAHYVEQRTELLARANELFEWVQRGMLRVRIGREFSLANAVDAHRALEGRETTGKVVLVP
jgi:NADPH2:quinone reductase